MIHQDKSYFCLFILFYYLVDYEYVKKQISVH